MMVKKHRIILKTLVLSCCMQYHYFLHLSIVVAAFNWSLLLLEKVEKYQEQLREFVLLTKKDAIIL